MTRLLRPSLVMVLALGLLVPAATRAEDQSKPRTFVVLVGAGTPNDAAIEPRPAAENDAKSLYDLLIDSKYLGVPAADARLLLGEDDKGRHAEPATRDQIVKALTWVSEKAGKDDLVIIGLFGRGATVGERTCLLTKGASVKDRAKNALLSVDVEHAVKGLKSEKLLVLVDIDYKGVTLDAKTALEPNTVDFAQAFVGDEDAEEKTLPPGRIVFVASANVARHLDDGKNGIFTRAVVDALQGKADVDGYEPDGIVTVDELQKYLDTAVIEQARKLGKTNEEKEQVPFIWGTRAYHFALTSNPAIAPKNAARIAKIAALDLPKEVVDEGTRLIGRMPKLQAQQDLRKQFIALADGAIKPAEFTEAREKIVKGMELDKDDAETFARRALLALETVKKVYIKELTLGDMVTWAVKGMYRALDEKLTDELQARLKDAPTKRRGALADLLADARVRLGKREDLEKNKDVDLAMKTAMFNLDPHTMYFSEEQVAQIQSKLLGQFTGIGVNVRRDMVRDGLLVISPIRGSPAYKAGIKTGDLITEIIREVDAKGNPIEPPEVTSTKGMKSDEAVKKIMGQPRTKVRIKVARDGADKPLEFDLLRARIDVETVMGVKRKPDDSWDHWIDAKKKIAYIRLTEFAPRSFEDLEEVVKNLHKEGVKGLLLDLRFNPGGSLTSAVQISDLFIEDGLIVTIKPRSGVDEEVAYTGKQASPTNRKYTNFPMVCLINGQSASASEIVSSCLQDQQRAIVLGERSFGKGSVQTIVDFPSTSAKIKLTTATFWRPTGKNLNKASTSGKDEDEWGVHPDEGFVVPLQREERLAVSEQLRELEIIPNPALKAKEPKPSVPDRQLEAALKHLRSQVTGDKDSAKKID